MKKKTLIYFMIFLSFGIIIYFIFSKLNLDNGNIGNKEMIVNISKNLENKKNKISWDENIKFTYCDSIEKYNENDTRADFFGKEDVKLLTEKMNNYNPKSNSHLDGFSSLIYEYCKTEDGNKFIFSSESKIPLTIGRYDKDLDIIEKTKLNSFVFKNLSNYYFRNRNYGDTSLEKYYKEYKLEKFKLRGFGKRNGNIIEFRNYGVPLIGNAGYAPGFFSDKRQFFSKSTVDYCDTGLTPGGKLSVCFADVFYDFDLFKNEITESRVCSYYVDDYGNIKTLEKCFDIDVKKSGYNLISKTKGFNFYQNENKDLSILEVDLNQAKISFDGANSFYSKENKNVLAAIYDKDGNIQVPALYDEKVEKKLEYENNNNLTRFNRTYADEFIKKYDYKFSDKEIIAFVNGQFFDQNKNPTSLSFPVVSNGKILNSYVDNDIEKRTFIIDNNYNAKIIPFYEKELLNKNYKELIVGFSPKVDSRKNQKIGRTYIGLQDNKKVIFFISKNKTQKEMEDIILNFGISYNNIIMMDGGPSTQFAYYENNGPGSEFERFYGKWEVPHFFVIYNN